MAVRIAQALSLNSDDRWPRESFFQQQMRRRLWYTICLLDLLSSVDRASEPQIALNSVHPSFPRNINDADICPAFDGEVLDRDEMTDMTFPLVLFHAQRTAKMLNFASVGEIVEPISPVSCNLDTREHGLEHFEQRTAQLLHGCNPDSSNYAWFVLNSSYALGASLKLSLYRPLQRGRIQTLPQAPGGSYLLNLAAMVLDKTHRLRTDARTEHFRWFEVGQWYALAVAITECYVCEDLSVIGRLWPLIEASFDHYNKLITDSSDEEFWRPMEELMRRTREKITSLSLQKQILPSAKTPCRQDSGGGYGNAFSTSVPQHGVDSFGLLELAGGGWTGNAQPQTGISSNSSHQITLPTHFAMCGAPGVPPGSKYNSPASSTALYANPTPSGSSAGAGTSDVDPAWTLWNEFVNGLPIDGFGGSVTGSNLVFGRPYKG